LLSLSTVVFAASDLPRPLIIVSPDVFYSDKDILYIEGRSVPNHEIEVLLQQPGEKPIQIYTIADENGEWVATSRSHIAEGFWEARARTIDGEGGQSPWSQQRVIESVATSIRFGSFSLSYSTISIILVLLFIGMLIFLQKRYAFMGGSSFIRNTIEEEVQKHVREHEYEDMKQQLNILREQEEKLEEHVSELKNKLS